jgi:ATP-dependent DNA helicase PIF1
MRFGRVNTHAFRVLSDLWRAVPIVNGVKPTELYATHYEVDRANSDRLSVLQTETKEYRTRDIPGTSDDGKPVSYTDVPKLLERMIAQSKLILKVGAQVMLIKNYGMQLVNGSLVIVLDHCSPEWARSQNIDISDEDPNHVSPISDPNYKLP